MDETERARCRAITLEVRELKSDCDRHSYVIGLRLSEVKRGRLYASDGYDDFKTYLAEAVDLSPEQTNKWIAVADNFSPETADLYRLERCWLWLRIIKATPEPDRPADILRATADGKPIAECSTRELEAYLARLTATAAAPVPERVKTLELALAGITRVGFGSSGYSFTGVAEARLCDLARGLISTLGCR